MLCKFERVFTSKYYRFDRRLLYFDAYRIAAYSVHYRSYLDNAAYHGNVVDVQDVVYYFRIPLYLIGYAGIADVYRVCVNSQLNASSNNYRVCLRA